MQSAQRSTRRRLSRRRLKDALRQRLIECGWRDDLKAFCRELIRSKGLQQLSVEELVAEAAPRGKGARVRARARVSPRSVCADARDARSPAQPRSQRMSRPSSFKPFASSSPPTAERAATPFRLRARACARAHASPPPPACARARDCSVCGFSSLQIHSVARPCAQGAARWWQRQRRRALTLSCPSTPPLRAAAAAAAGRPRWAAAAPQTWAWAAARRRGRAEPRAARCAQAGHAPTLSRSILGTAGGGTLSCECG
jgi:hypothetical protein